MVGFGLHAFFLKECCGLFDFSARGPVDDARFPLMAAEKRKQLGMRFLFGQDMIEQVRTVERLSLIHIWEMAAGKPASREAMLGIAGVGERKLAQYGDCLLYTSRCV